MRHVMLSSLLTLTACAESVRSTNADASADVSDTADDVTPSRCVWSAGTVRDLTLMGARSCELIDAVAGAWVLRACAFDGMPSGLVLSRVDSVIGETAPTLHPTDGAATAHLRNAALAYDARTGGGAVVLASTAGPRLVGFDARGMSQWSAPLSSAQSMFSLGAHRGPIRRTVGYAVIADEIRALWGTDLLITDALGAVTEVRNLDVESDGQPEVSRFTLGDGGFALGWVVPRGDASGPLAMRVFDEGGRPLGATLTAGVIASRGRYAIAGDARGLVVAWESAVDTLPALTGVTLRSTDRSGAARGSDVVLSSLGFYGGGLDVALARDVALVSAVVGSGVLRLVVLPTSRDGEALSAPLSVSPVDPLTPDLTRTRVVATDRGALVAFQRTRDVVAVAPIECAP